MVATGKTKPLPKSATRSRGARIVHFLAEYRCVTCGHRGWSRHIDIERQLQKMGVAVPEL